ncbi:MAG: CaiB/BaiF CoA-transferase family protein [Maricaulaceae bacterium]
MAGALKGLRIIEFAGLGPAPFCAMMLADHGAEIIRIDRIGSKTRTSDPTLRSRKSIALNLKDPNAIALAKELVKSADGLIEGLRPGVMERLGLGPEELLKDNPKLIYGRMTGWGQSGPYAPVAGHDINYIALAGALHGCGRAGEKPTPPVNYVGDYGGGGMMLAFGMVSAFLAVKNGASGQVIDCAMTDGTATLMAAIWGLHADDLWRDERGVNLLDGGAHFYDTYETKDGKYISIGSIEPKFYQLLLEKTGLADDPAFEAQRDKAAWAPLSEKLTRVFILKTRDEWCEIMEMTDVCFAPVLSLAEAPHHPHNVARGTFVNVDGVVQPAPSPRFLGTPSVKPKIAPQSGADTDHVLTALGHDAAAIAALRSSGTIG